MEMYGNGFIGAYNPGDAPFLVAMTMDQIPPNTDIFTSIALSAFAPGIDFDNRVVGDAGVVVRRWQVFNPDGSVSTVDPGPNQVWCNSMFIENCASITWELSAVLAEVYAQISVFRY
jgi:hypothetical protein